MAQNGRSDLRVTASDALEFEPVVANPPKSRWGLWLFAVLVLAAGGAGAWHFYGADVRKLILGGDGGIPLIKANTAPVKVRPDNPGGLEVPDRDKQVYDRIHGTPEGRGPERLLPPPEQPLPKPSVAKAAPKSEPKSEPQIKSVPADLPVSAPAKPVQAIPTAKDVANAERPVPPPPPAPPATSGVGAPVLPLIKRTTTKKETPQPAVEAASPAPVKESIMPAPPPTAVAKQPEPEKTPVVAATPPSAPVPAPQPVSADRAYLVQLAAARTQEGAETEWEKLRGKNQDLLGNLRLFVTKADLGAKGVYYRLRAGPITDEAAARNICSQLATRQVGCLIIKPGQ